MNAPVLQLGPRHPPLEAALDEAGFDVVRLRDHDEPGWLLAHGASFRAAVTSALHGIDAGTLRALPALRAVASFGVGMDQVDLAAVAAAGVSVSNTPGVLHDCTADIAFGLLIDVARGLSAGDRYVRRGAWPQAPFALGRRVSGSRLGIVGLGQIGRAVARRADGFGMTVRYTSRRVVADVPYGYEADVVELARWADFLVVAVAGGEPTRGLVSRAVLDALGPEGFLINVARGSVVDEEALVAALRERRIAGAGLDVYDHEPHVPDALFALDNVVLAPHLGSATHATRIAMGRLVAENLEHFFRTGALLTPFDA